MTSAIIELLQVMSERKACAHIGLSRASFQRSQQPPMFGCRRPRKPPANRLTDPEQQAVLDVLNAPEHCDLAPTQIWARLLDCGIYLCSISTMYRLLRGSGQCMERRQQRSHPAKKKPELLATRPLQVWSWDITKLRGPTRGVTYDLYVIIDIYSRFVVGWTIANTETAELATELIKNTMHKYNIKKRQLSLHADRGTAMTSKSVAQLLVDLGVERSHSRPRVSNDNPYSEAAFKTLKYCPAFPGRFGSIEDARAFCTEFFDYYNHEHYHSGIGLLTPATVHNGQAPTIIRARTITLQKAYNENPHRFPKPPTPPQLPTQAWINNPSKEALIKTA
jgi:putative transposase